MTNRTDKLIAGYEKVAEELTSQVQFNVLLRKALLTAIFRIEKNMPQDDTQREETQAELKRLKRCL